MRFDISSRIFKFSALLWLGTSGFILSAVPALSDEPPDCGLYTYRAEVVRVIDGDTVVAEIDLGFNVWLRDEHLRLNGIDAPEKNTEGAERATEALMARIDLETVFICTTKAKRSDKEAKGSFGRYLATIHHEGRNINEWLLKSALVCPYVEGKDCNPR